MLLTTSPRLFAALCAFLSLTFVTACQQTGPRIETRQDNSANFSHYKTYALLRANEPTADAEVASYFVNAIREQMDARGYTYTESQPDLLINYQVNIQNVLKEMGNAAPARVNEAGYYSHSRELYQEIPTTEETTRLFIERSGAARIDIIDAKKRQTIWQGDAEGRLTEDALLQPKEPIRATVADLLGKFPKRKN